MAANLIIVFRNIAQVYTSASVGAAIAFIIRDIGEPGLAGWAIQVRLTREEAPTKPSLEARADTFP